MNIFLRKTNTCIANTYLHKIIGGIGQNCHLSSYWCELTRIIDKRVDHKECQRFIGFHLQICLRNFKRELLLSKSRLLHGDNTKDVTEGEACHLQAKLSLLHLNPRSQAIIDGHHARTQLLYIREAFRSIFAHFIELFDLSNDAVKVRDDSINDGQLGALKDVSLLLLENTLLHYLTFFPTLFQAFLVVLQEILQFLLSLFTFFARVYLAYSPFIGTRTIVELPKIYYGKNCDQNN